MITCCIRKLDIQKNTQLDRQYKNNYTNQVLNWRMYKKKKKSNQHHNRQNYIHFKWNKIEQRKKTFPQISWRFTKANWQQLDNKTYNCTVFTKEIDNTKLMFQEEIQKQSSYESTEKTFLELYKSKKQKQKKLTDIDALLQWHHSMPWLGLEEYCYSRHLRCYQFWLSYL